MPFLPLLFQAINEVLAAQTSVPANQGIDTAYVILGGGLLTLFGTLGAAYFTMRGNEKIAEANRQADAAKAEIVRLTTLQSETQISLEMAKQEIDLDSYALSFSVFMESWNEIAAQLNEIFKKTKTSRFLILRAWNGYEAPRYTTAVIQYRQGQVEHSDYIHFELDEDYVDKLLKTRRRKMWKVDTSKEGDTAIGGIYRSETPPVLHANWYFIHDEKVDEKRVVITYCSFGTAESEPFEEREEYKHRLLVNLIQEKFDGRGFITR